MRLPPDASRAKRAPFKAASTTSTPLRERPMSQHAMRVDGPPLAGIMDDASDQEGDERFDDEHFSDALGKTGDDGRDKERYTELLRTMTAKDGPQREMSEKISAAMLKNFSKADTEASQALSKATET